MRTGCVAASFRLNVTPQIDLPQWRQAKSHHIVLRARGLCPLANALYNTERM